jgi:hypothetical protein
MRVAGLRAPPLRRVPVRNSLAFLVVVEGNLLKPPSMVELMRRRLGSAAQPDFQLRTFGIMLSGPPSSIA